MASTVTAATLTVTITENIVLNSQTYGNSITKSYTTQGEVDQRIMNVATSGTVIFSYDTADGGGTGVKNDYAYFRITNLDDTNFIRVEVNNGADTFFTKVKAGESFLLMDNEMDAIASSSTFGAFADLTSVKCTADTAAVDIEYIAVTA
tara:strand:- start:125 stop:571 length:447 start_codon:yes stop_codon:yes gene_type:complete